MIRLRPIRLTAAALSVALIGHAARAAECRLHTTPMSFGAYSPSQPATGVASLTVTCLSPTAQSVSFSIRPAVGFTDDRALSGNGLGKLGYRLYVDPAFSQPLTAASSPITGQLTLLAGRAQSEVFTLYGRAPSRQNAQAGAYADTIDLVLTVP